MYSFINTQNIVYYLSTDNIYINTVKYKCVFIIIIIIINNLVIIFKNNNFISQNIE